MSPSRLVLPVALLLFPLLAIAHAAMDFSVAVDAPPWLRANETRQIPVTANVRAFDPAFAVVITVNTSAEFTGVTAPAGWQCTREAKRVQCTIEELASGPHTFTVAVMAPDGGPVITTADIVSIGTDDPDLGNNTSSATSRVYAPSSCMSAAPAIVSAGAGEHGTAEVVWSPSAGARAYEVLAGIDGAAPRLLGTTTANRWSTRLLGGGDITWTIRATFENCPSIESAPSTVAATGPAERLAVSSITSPLFLEPVAVTLWRNKVLVADAGKHAILAHLIGSSTVFPERLDGEVTVTPLVADGGIAFGPGEYLYIADRGNDLVRYAYPGIPRYVFTFAGQPGTPGSLDGVGTAARVRAPLGVAVDERSHVYVSDSGNHTIRRGIFEFTKGEFAIVTLAGAPGEAGSSNGIGSSARFNDPAGIAVDADGNVIIADRGNHLIRRMTPAGDVTTIAGLAGEAGHRDASGSQALFNRPTGVAVDPRGNVLVTEEGNHTVRKIAPNGRVTTVAGQPGAAGSADGAGEAARFNRPALLTIAPDGTIWIADAGNAKLRRATFVPPPGSKRRSVR